MKKGFSVCLVVIVCAALFSCSHYNMRRVSQADAIVTGGSIASEKAEVWTRPLEIGFQPIGPAVEGHAESAVGDTALGEDENYLATNVFVDPNSKTRIVVQTADYSNLLKRAIINAMKESGADGFYLTMYEVVREDTDKVNFKGDSKTAKIKKTAWVKGIPLKMVIHDEISYEKARTHKFCDRFCATKDTCPTACIFPKYELDTIKMDFNSKTLPDNKQDSNVELKMEINGKQKIEK
ncbi:hypothetical protein IKS86_02755 [bacterium]|nr:hypothetical protein [bacterium]